MARSPWLSPAPSCHATSAAGCTCCARRCVAWRALCGCWRASRAATWRSWTRWRLRSRCCGSPARARLLRLVRGRAAPEVATPAVGVPVVFYCHFPDKLLATGEAAGAAGSASLLPRPRGPLALVRAAYRLPFDLLEELCTGAASAVLVNSAYTASVFAASFPLLRRLGCTPSVLHPSISLANNRLLAWPAPAEAASSRPAPPPLRRADASPHPPNPSPAARTTSPSSPSTGSSARRSAARRAPPPEASPEPVSLPPVGPRTRAARARALARRRRRGRRRRCGGAARACGWLGRASTGAGRLPRRAARRGRRARAAGVRRAAHERVCGGAGCVVCAGGRGGLHALL